MVTTRPRSSTVNRLSTRVLLICAALAAVQVGLFIALSPMLVSLPALSPPLYAVVAGVHSTMTFLAPRVTGARWSATITAVIAGLLIAAMSPIGLFVAVLIVIPGLMVDLALLLPVRAGRERGSEARYFSAALAAAAVLFFISLPAFSADHLTAVILIGSAIGRIVGELLAWIIARALAAGLRRAGVNPPSPAR